MGQAARDAGEVRTLPKTQVNASDLLPANRGYFTFDHDVLETRVVIGVPALLVQMNRRS